ncbi:MAG: ribosome biogenesis GTP-binding protein YihA/YsxC [Gammaproteobacteria bacterium]|nr:ribosome biogenesis GTP-binding protein YihA/YsxC [Gammaproteobacteria bacterium]
MQNEDPQLRAYFARASFLKSAPDPAHLPADRGAEICFAGRSNAGKSSALNTLCAQKTLARASKRPGCTQLLNVFVLDGSRRLIDLPGYGYAEAPKEMRQNWGLVMDEYFSTRRSLKLVVLMMDIRHPLRPFDVMLIESCTARGLPVHVLLTKADKLSRGAASGVLQKLKRTLPEGVTVQLFSSLTGTGVEEARARLREVLENHGEVGPANEQA